MKTKTYKLPKPTYTLLTDLPLAGKGQTHTESEWKRIYGYIVHEVAGATWLKNKPFAISREDETNRLNEIAKMIGWYQDLKGHDTGSWFKRTDTAIVVAYSVHNNYPFKELPFRRDYNYLMQAFEFMRVLPAQSNQRNRYVPEIIIDRFEFHRNSVYLAVMTWEELMWKDNTIYYIVGENAETYQDAMFFAISDFAKMYNEYKERNPEKPKKVKKAKA
jgi:hypothetical protein